MALLDVTGLAQSHRGMSITHYCNVTEQVLSGYLRNGNFWDDGSDRCNELLAHVRVYFEAGQEKDALGIRAPLVFWLVICGWTSPQVVLARMVDEAAGPPAQHDLARLFMDRWILDSLIEHWDPQFYSGHRPTQRDYPLLPVAPAQPHVRIVRGVVGRGMTTTRVGHGLDEFTQMATAWSYRQGYLTEAVLEPLTNEPALPALLGRPQVFYASVVGFNGPGELRSVEQRWTDLVKHSIKALVEKNAGPGTARLVFESIAQGLKWFEQERQR